MNFRYHHGDLKEALVQVGFEHLESTRESFSLRSLARQLQVSHGAPYRHFKNREALLFELGERVYGEFLAELRKLRFRSDLNSEAKMKSLILWLQAYWGKHPERCKLLSTRPIADGADFIDELSRMLMDQGELASLFWLMLCGAFSSSSVQSLDKFLRLMR